MAQQRHLRGSYNEMIGARMPTPFPPHRASVAPMRTLASGAASLHSLTGASHDRRAVNYKPFLQRLPDAVQAIFVLPGSGALERERARKVRRAFCETFALPEARIPIAMYDPTKVGPFQRCCEDEIE